MKSSILLAAVCILVFIVAILGVYAYKGHISDDVVLLRSESLKDGRPDYVPVIRNLKKITLNGMSFNISPFALASSVEDLPLHCEAQGATKQTIKNIRDKYLLFGDIETTESRFSPYYWACDADRISGYFILNKGDDQSSEALKSLDTYMRKHLVEPRPDTIFTAYPFDYRAEGYLEHRGWTSGMGTGLVLYGYTSMYKATGNQSYAKIARSLFNGFLHPRDFQKKQSLWVSCPDESGWLWFEEYPYPEDPQGHVINGHIWAIQSLYYYNSIFPSKECESLIRAGIASVKANIWLYRIPGGINKYSQRKNLQLDYGPGRLLNQLNWMYKTTKDPYFDFARQTFLCDFIQAGRTHLYCPKSQVSFERISKTPLYDYANIAYGSVPEFENKVVDSLFCAQSKTIAKAWLEGKPCNFNIDHYTPTGSPLDYVDLNILILMKETSKSLLERQAAGGDSR